METTLYILLTITLVSRPTICTPAPEETNSDEGREQTQIDQLYQIYKATQNNIIQLNTEVSLINDQLAELREKSASKSKVDDELSHLSSTVKSNFRQLLTDFQHLENEVVLNNSRKIDRVYSEVNAVNDRLQSSVSSLNTANGATTTQLNSLQSSVSSLSTANGATTTQLNSLQSSVSSLNAANGATTTQLNSLQSSVNSLNTTTMTQLNSLQSSTTTQLNSLQTSVNSLTTRVNSPVNLYQNCIQETRSCTNYRSGSVYWNYCRTLTLPASKSGYYTLSMDCKYDRPPHRLDTSTLRQIDGSNVECVCVTTHIDSSTGSHLSYNFPQFTCTLVITRCPISQNIV